MSDLTDTVIRWTVISFKDGEDTFEIAKRWHMPECDIERALHIGLERRRVQRVAEQLGANV